MFDISDSMFNVLYQCLGYFAVLALWLSIRNVFPKNRYIPVIHGIASAGILLWLWLSGLIDRTVGEMAGEISNFADSNWHQLSLVAVMSPILVPLLVWYFFDGYMRLRKISNEAETGRHENISRCSQ